MATQDKQNTKMRRLITRIQEDLEELIDMTGLGGQASTSGGKSDVAMVAADNDTDDDESESAESDGEEGEMENINPNTNGQGRVKDPSHDRRLKNNQGSQSQPSRARQGQNA